jgi:hypothetical protein
MGGDDLDDLQREQEEEGCVRHERKECRTIDAVNMKRKKMMTLLCKSTMRVP